MAENSQSDPPLAPLTVRAFVKAPIEKAWRAYVGPEHLVRWNFASPEWHCPRATADLREGGILSARMEAKDGSMGFDFEGRYTKVEPPHLLAYEFGGRHATIRFYEEGEGTQVEVTFDPEQQFPIEHQQAGWQAILENYAAHAAGWASAAE